VKSIVGNDDLNRKLADHVMILDVMGKLTGLSNETEVIQEMMELFSVLFAPASLIYLPFRNGQPEEIVAGPSVVPVNEETKDRLIQLKGKYAWTRSGNGFLLRIQQDDKTIGIIEIDEVLFPDQKRHYLNLAMSTAPVVALAVTNARNYQKLQQTGKEREKLITELQAALANVKKLSGMLPICASCKKIRDDEGYWNQIEAYIGKHSEATFSHGICPECARKLYPDIFKEDDSLKDDFPLPLDRKDY